MLQHRLRRQTEALAETEAQLKEAVEMRNLREAKEAAKK